MGRLNRILDVSQQPVNLTFISSYIPRKCGIATFTKDLTKAINDLNPQNLVKIVAANHDERYEYPHEVVYEIEKDDIQSYANAANFLNKSSSDIVCLQHEYGLYGGPDGEYIFKLLGRIRQPIVTTLHTILVNPTEQQREVLFRLAKASEAVVAMIPDAKERLERDYGIHPDKVVVIHHGVSDNPKSVRSSKEKLGWKDRRVLLMTGLLNPNKGIEYVIKALPEIKKKFPNVLFAVVGQTHPEIIKHDGEVYRDSLVALTKELDVEDNVEFVNRYLSLEDLLSYYDGCDIYLTPHLDEQQITSGTLAYAIGMGKACVSSPYVYAREMLANDAGMLVKFRDHKTISDTVTKILGDPDLQVRLENNAYRMGRQMSWPLVAERYLMLFRIVQETYGLTQTFGD